MSVVVQGTHPDEKNNGVGTKFDALALCRAVNCEEEEVVEHGEFDSQVETATDVYFSGHELRFRSGPGGTEWGHPAFVRLVDLVAGDGNHAEQRRKRPSLPNRDGCPRFVLLWAEAGHRIHKEERAI